MAHHNHNVLYNVRQPLEIRPGEFDSFLTSLYAVAKLQDERTKPQPPRPSKRSAA